MNAHEQGFATFLSEPGQRRIRTLFEMGFRKRDKLRALLDHSVRLDPRYAHRLQEGAEGVLRQHGAPDTCYVISADKRLDGREMPLAEALSVIGRAGGGFVSCLPGKLGFYAYEDGCESYLLKK